MTGSLISTGTIRLASLLKKLVVQTPLSREFDADTLGLGSFISQESNECNDITVGQNSSSPVLDYKMISNWDESDLPMSP